MSPLVWRADSVSVASDTVNVGNEHCVYCPEALVAGPEGHAALGLSEPDELTLDSASDTEALLSKLTPTPVPKLQLAALCLARLADPLTFTQVSSIYRQCTASHT